MADIANPTDGTLEASLNRTDFGHMLYEYRKVLLAVVGLVFVAVSGWLLYKQARQARMVEMAGKVNAFENTAVAGLRTGTITAADFVAKFNALDSDVRTSTAMVPVALSAAETLAGKGDVVNAQAVLKPLAEGVPADNAAFVFLAHNYAALAENNGQADQAIAVLEKYIGSGHKVFLAKARLDLGRLYLAKGDKARAKQNLDVIVADHPNDELAKLARLYLQRLASAP